MGETIVFSIINVLLSLVNLLQLTNQYEYIMIKPRLSIWIHSLYYTLLWVLTNA